MAADVTDRSDGARSAVNASLHFTGQAVYLLMQWCLLMALARLGGPETLGQFAFAFAVTTPPMVFASLQLRALIAGDTKIAANLGSYAGLRVLTTVIALVGCLGLGVILNAPKEVWWTIAGLAVAKGLDAFGEVYRTAVQSTGRFGLIAGANILRGALGLAGGVGAFVVTHDTGWAAWGMLGGWLLAMLVSDLPAALQRFGWHALIPSFAWSQLRSQLAVAAPLGLVALLLAVTQAIPIYALNHWRDHATTGIYSALVQVLLLGGLLVTSLGATGAPKIARLLDIGDSVAAKRTHWRIAWACTALSPFAAGMAAVVGSTVLGIAFGTDFSGYWFQLVLLALAMAGWWFASGLGYGLTTVRRVGGQAAISTLAAISCAICAALLVPDYGVDGAIAAIGAASLVLAAGYAWMSIRLWKYSPTAPTETR